jgi:molybdopterin-guanine dinucleotide biosynthesis protein A
MITLSAMLLVGGRSRRMGVNKASILIGDEPLWQRQLRILGELAPKALWISARETPSWCPPKLEVVMDEPPSRGPLSGVTAGLRRLKTSHLLVCAIDLPRMTSEHLRQLSILASDGVGVFPSHDDYFEPLCAIYPAEALAAAEELLASSDAALQRLAQNLLNRSQARVCDVTPMEKPLYLNMNTLAEVPPA